MYVFRKMFPSTIQTQTNISISHTRDDNKTCEIEKLYTMNQANVSGILKIAGVHINW